MESEEKPDNSNFENMAQRLSEDERHLMLEKMSSGKESQAFEDENGEKLNYYGDDEISLSAYIRQDNFFRKFILWLKSLIYSKSIEEVYNQDLIKKIAREIEREVPGLINYRQKIFCNLFYEKLSETAKFQSYLKKYIDKACENEGEFFIEFGSLIMGDFQEEIKKLCDPFQFPEEQSVGTEVRASLLKKMDTHLSEISSESKSLMYSGARFFEWLKNFNKIPFSDFLKKFTDGTYGKECPFALLKDDFNFFVKIMSFDLEINEEVFYALFYNYQNSSDEKNFEESENLNSFLKNTATYSELLFSFMRSVKIEDLGKLVFENALYSAEKFGGFEAWFKKYKAYWKVLFDRRWNERNYEHKKTLVLKKIDLDFGQKKFPVFPNRPWKKLLVNIEFKYDLTAGFLYYFFKEEFPKHKKVLRILTLEANFSVKENRNEFTEHLNEISEISDDIQILAEEFSDSGEVYETFAQCMNENLLKKNHLDSINLILDETCSNIESIMEKFSKSSYSLCLLMNAFCGELESSAYGRILNFNQIRGMENAGFRSDFDKCRNAFKYASEIASELQNLENSVR